MRRFHYLRAVLPVLTAFALAATAGCGGGGSGGSALPQSANSNANTNANTNANPGAQAAGGPRNWTVDAGASRRDGALQALVFASDTIVIDEGDSVTWTSASIHTVSFLEGSSFTPFNAPIAPAGSNVEDGTAFTSSGVIVAGQTYTLTFPKAGTYVYNCLLHPPEMAGTVVVQPAGTPYPHPQGFYTGQGNKLANGALSGAQDALQLFPFERDGTTVAAGISPGLSSLPPSQSTVWRFLDDKNLDNTVTIPLGTTITWVNESNNEPHTVTFPIAGQPLPPLPGDPFTPPIGGSTYDGTSLTNSGPLGTAVGLPGNTYSLTFTARGTFKYFCLFHDDFGMEGTVIVK
jgi:plastocyanin